MPKVAFKEEFVKKNDYSFPKLKLKKNEIARIVLLEDPQVEYVHNLRKPKLNGGVAETETKYRFRDGEPYEDYKYEFVGRPICLGDYATLEAQGADPEHCPICREATRSDKFSAPQRRFALHAFKYETQPNKTEVKEPFQVTPLIWSFTDKVFTKLFEYQQEWGDLRTRDLILKCENEPFQTYDISVAAKAEWTTSDSRKQTMKAVMAPENLAPDLAVFCGSKKNETQIGYDIRAINEVWAIINGQSAVSANDAALSSVGGSLNLADGIDDLLGGDSSPAPETKAEDPWAATEAGETGNTYSEDAPFDREEKKPEASSTTDLDDLLNSL